MTQIDVLANKHEPPGDKYIYIVLNCLYAVRIRICIYCDANSIRN